MHLSHDLQLQNYLQAVLSMLKHSCEVSSLNPSPLSSVCCCAIGLCTLSQPACKVRDLQIAFTQTTAFEYTKQHRCALTPSPCGIWAAQAEAPVSSSSQSSPALSIRTLQKQSEPELARAARIALRLP